MREPTEVVTCSRSGQLRSEVRQIGYFDPNGKYYNNLARARSEASGVPMLQIRQERSTSKEGKTRAAAASSAAEPSAAEPLAPGLAAEEEVRMLMAPDEGCNQGRSSEESKACYHSRVQERCELQSSSRYASWLHGYFTWSSHVGILPPFNCGGTSYDS